MLSLKIGFLCFLWQLRHAWRCWDILFHFWRVTFWCFFDFQSFDRICIAKLYVISILFFMFFLKAVMAQLTRIDSFLQTYFSIFCEKLRIHLENCFVIFFFATAPCMAQLKHLIHFWRVNFWCFFEYQSFGRICFLFNFVWRILWIWGERKIEFRWNVFGELFLVKKVFSFFFWQVVRYVWLRVWWNLGRKQKCIFFKFIFDGFWWNLIFGEMFKKNFWPEISASFHA